MNTQFIEHLEERYWNYAWDFRQMQRELKTLICDKYIL